MEANACPCCQARADVARLTAERDALRWAMDWDTLTGIVQEALCDYGTTAKRPDGTPVRDYYNALARQILDQLEVRWRAVVGPHSSIVEHALSSDNWKEMYQHEQSKVEPYRTGYARQVQALKEAHATVADLERQLSEARASLNIPAMLQIRDASNALHTAGIEAEPHEPHEGCTTQLGHRVRALAAERDADRACAAGFAAELAQAHDLLASAVPGGPLAARIQALLSLWAASVVEKAKLQREVATKELAHGALGVPVEAAQTGVESREALAAYAHEAWSGWMQYLFGKGEFEDDDTWTMPAWAVARWQRQMLTPYADLSEEEKASDRDEADKMLAIMRNTPQNPSERPQDAPGRNDGVMSCARCGAALNNVSPGYSVVAGGTSVCASCLRPGEELLRAKGISL